MMMPPLQEPIECSIPMTTPTAASGSMASLAPSTANTRKRRRSAFVEASAKLADVAATHETECISTSSEELDARPRQKKRCRSTKARSPPGLTKSREQEARVLAVFDMLVSLTYELYCGDEEENHDLFRSEAQQVSGEDRYDYEYHEDEPCSQQVRHSHDDHDACTGLFDGSQANDQDLPEKEVEPLIGHGQDSLLDHMHQEPAGNDSSASAAYAEFPQYGDVLPEAMWWSLAHQIKEEPEDNEEGDDTLQLAELPVHAVDVFAAGDDTDFPMMQEEVVYPLAHTSTYGIEDFIAGAPLLSEATTAHAGLETMDHREMEQHFLAEPSAYEETVLASGSLMGEDEDSANWCASVFA